MKAGFPHWLTEALVFPYPNADGEQLAAGVKMGELWLVRFSKYSGEWCSVRHALPQEQQLYDDLFLKRMRISGSDNRPNSNAGRFFLRP